MDFVPLSFHFTSTNTVTTDAPDHGNAIVVVGGGGSGIGR